MDFKEKLTKCIKDSLQTGEFHWDSFFDKWFRMDGTPLFFLFKKNLSVTNLQYVELFQLINSNIKSDENKLFFYKAEHVRQTFSELIESVLQSRSTDSDHSIEDFVDSHYQIFKHTVSVDLFFNSCSVFLPPGIDIDLSSVVFESGYIHSAGFSVYIRNIKKANKVQFKDNVKRELEVINDKVPFVVYSHEDFSDFDKDSNDQIDKGIDQCKIYIDKMNMGSHRLAQVIDDLANESPFREKLISPIPGNYKEKHQFKSPISFWLISDRSVSGGSIKYPGQSRFYICYKQVYKNESHYYYFDENKPAWKSHTTLPHSLTAALINSCRPFDSGIKMSDPFGGTSTTWLEAKRIFAEIDCSTSDWSNIISLLLEDNLNFFSLDYKDLRGILNMIKNVKEKIEDNDAYSYDLFDGDFKSSYQLARDLINELKKEFPKEENEFEFSLSFVDKLEQMPFVTRIIFYIALRSTLRYNSSFKRKSMSFEDAFKKSSDKLVSEITKLINLKIELENEDFSLDSRYFAIRGKYSLKLVPKSIADSQSFLNAKKIEVRPNVDARDLIPDCFDIILCDPPYGFNTEEDIKELSLLYDTFLTKAIMALKSNGQLIICLPAESYTGKDLPYCTRIDVVSRLILIKSMELGRKVYKLSTSLPLKDFEPPYYWESDKALRRGILHFRFD